MSVTLSIATSNSKALGSRTSGSAVCISVCLTSLTPRTVNSWLELFVNLVKILWRCVTKSAITFRTSLVLGCKPFLKWLMPLHNSLTYLLHAAEFFLRSTQILSYSRNSPHFRNPKVQNRINKCPSLVPFLTQLDPIYILTSYSLKIYPHIILPSTSVPPKWSLSLRFPHQNPVYSSLLPHARYMARPSHSSRFYQPHNIWWAVQIIKLLIM